MIWISPNLDILIDQPNCEQLQTNSGLQIFNIISSLALILSAYMVKKLLKGTSITNPLLRSTWIIVLLTGAGSILHHTFPNGTTLLLDGASVFLFLVTFLYLYLKALTQKRQLSLILTSIFLTIQLASLVFVKADFDITMLIQFINIPVLITLILLGYRKFSNTTHYLLATFVTYGIAIAFLFTDLTYCSLLPFGTHFLWHVFNALTAYLGIMFLVKIKK